MFKRTTILTTSIGCIVLPIAFATSCGSLIKSKEETIKFDKQEFKNKDALSAYLESQYKITDKNGDKWSLFNGKQNEYFDSPTNLYNALDKYIDQMQTYLPDNLNKVSIDGRLLDYPISSNRDSLQEIYKGKQGNYYLSDTDAINSMIEVHNAYKYNGIYFRTKEDFKSYLVKNPDVLKKFVKEFEYIRTSDEYCSENYDQSINTKLAFKKFVEPFVVSNSNKAYNIDSPNQILLEDKDLVSKIKVEDIPYIEIKDTNGLSEYNIDSSKDTPGSLIGPNILETEVNPTKLIIDVKQWHSAGSFENPTEYNPANIVEEKMFDFQLATSLPKDVKSITDLLKYNMRDKDFLTTYSNGEQNDFSNLENDLNDVKVDIPNYQNIGLFEALHKTELSLSKGKNYGFLTSISILRSWLIDNALNNNLSLNIIDEINKSFDFATRILNFQLHKKIDIILSDRAKKFDISKIFDFNEKNKNSYGEFPNVYLQKFLEGKDINNKYPEATEIILSSGLLSGILDEMYIKQKNKDYSFPNSFHKLITYSPKSEILKGSIQIWNDFEKNDDLAISTYRTSSKEFQQNMSEFSKLLLAQDSLMKAYVEQKSRGQASLTYEGFVENKIISTTAKSQDAISNEKELFNLGEKVINTISNISTICKTIGMVGQLAEAAGSTCPILLIATTAVTVVLDIVSAIIGEEKFDLYEYTHHDNKGQKYLWNGASHKEHTFFGINFGNSDKVTLDSLKVLIPIKIRTSSTSGMFYYNKKKYATLDEVKQNYIDDLKNGAITSDKVTNTLHIKSSMIDKTYSGTIDKIIDEMWKDKDSIFSKGIISDEGVSYSSGLNVEEIVTQLLDTIKPITIIELPDIIDGELKHPGTYRMPITYDNYLFGAPKPPIDYSLEHKYLISDPNIKESIPGSIDSTKSLTHPLSNSEIIDKFKNLYHVNSKNVLKYDILKNKTGKYDDLNRVIPSKEIDGTLVNNLKTIFKAKAPDGETEMFIDKGIAYEWLLVKMNFSFINVSNKCLYSYKENTFLSLYEFVNWIMNLKGEKNE